MPTSPRGANELVDGQAIPETTVNEIIRHTEAGACLFPVVDQDLTAPPGTCADGANYIIAASPTGLWSGKAKQIATALGTNAANGWRYHVPVEGFFAFVQDEDLLFKYDGADWVEFAGGGGDWFQGEFAGAPEDDYPVGVAGDGYYISSAGRVGGPAGKIVELGDLLICKTDNDGGDEAAVGADWFVVDLNRTLSNNGDLDSDTGAPSTVMPTSEFAVKTYVDAQVAGLGDIQVLLSTLPPNDDPEDPQPIITGSVPIYRDDGVIDPFWETAFSIEAGHVLGTVADGADILTNFYHLGVIFDEAFGNTEGGLVYRDSDFWDFLPPPAIDATQYVLSITDGVFSYIDADSVGSSYTNENAQDAVGGIVDTTLVYTDATPLLSRAALTGAITAAEGSNTTALGSFTKSDLDTAVSDGNVVYTGAATGSGLTMATARLLGRTTASSGAIEEIAVAGGILDLSGGNLTASEASDSEMWTGTSATKVVTPNKILDAAAFQTLADAAPVAPDFNAGFNFDLALSTSRTISNPTNAKSGQSGIIRIVQPGGGSAVATWGNNWRFPGGAAVGGVLSTTGSAVDILSYIVGSDGKIYATLAKAMAA